LNVKKRILSVAWYVVSAPFVLLFVITLLYSRHFPEANLVAIQYAADMNGPDLGPVLIAMVIKALLLSGLVLLGLWSVRRIVGRLDLEIRIKLQRVTKVIVVPRIVGTIETVAVLSCATMATVSLIRDISLPAYIAWRSGIEARAEKLVAEAPVLDGSRLVAHAGGAIDGYAYTNSIEAVRLNYDLGHRVFEIDLNLMNDGEILCAHDIGHLNSITGLEETLPDSASYLARKVYGSYSVTTLASLFEFMRVHRDMYLVTDSKTAHDAGREDLSNAEYNRLFWTEFARVARIVDPTVLDRVVPQLYYREMLEEVEESFSFKRYILTLYASSMVADEIVRFAYEHPEVSAVTMWPARLDEPALVQGLRSLGVPIYVHTINDLKDAKYLMFKGAYGLYTDSMLPEQVYSRPN